MGTEAGPGSRVKIHFTLSLEDGTEALSTLNEEPLECVLGDGTLRPGMEMALYGMRAGEEDRVTLTPEQGWGEHDPQLIHNLPRSRFPANMALEPGQIIAFDSAGGEEMAGAILSLDEQRVEVDFNHPLAGRNVVFWVKLLEVE
ncbi:MAG: peptidylprolyl isomerase [Gammaproteobacteria bacterium]|nr:MAG: peptidylprolyl isomerase [Gammaproteobacteria bacterium]RTZ76316.1 MAG: peptidylprolyl isomerase [Gammaproteobacteria bacterium]RTZ78956.1 MAG: peptidylprolyl isomerase [Gammaproteobacteria bacterium]